MREIFKEDTTLAKMLQSVQKNIVNLFEGTSPNWKIIGDPNEKVKISIMRRHCVISLEYKGGTV